MLALMTAAFNISKKEKRSQGATQHSLYTLPSPGKKTPLLLKTHLNTHYKRNTCSYYEDIMFQVWLPFSASGLSKMDGIAEPGIHMFPGYSNILTKRKM